MKYLFGGISGISVQLNIWNIWNICSVKYLFGGISVEYLFVGIYICSVEYISVQWSICSAEYLLDRISVFSMSSQANKIASSSSTTKKRLLDDCSPVSGSINKRSNSSNCSDYEDACDETITDSVIGSGSRPRSRGEVD